MNTEQPARPTPPASANALFQSLPQRRIVCDGLRLHRFCLFAHCRRTQRCQGDPRDA